MRENMLVRAGMFLIRGALDGKALLCFTNE